VAAALERLDAALPALRQTFADLTGSAMPAGEPQSRMDIER
jgi:hypothetical protein